MSEGQTHPLSVYFWIWGLLFVLSAFSYAVDYLEFQGIVRWSLVLIFMFLKAGFIIAIFMHMVWERMAFATAILVPPALLLFFIGMMQIEGRYTEAMRVEYFGDDVAVYEVPHAAVASEEHH
jgi:cytochrome c oxidase subunit IV